MSNVIALEQPYPRPLSGVPVERLPSARIPSRSPLVGDRVELVVQDAAAHAADLYAAGHESGDAPRIWDYLAYVPWASLDDSNFDAAGVAGTSLFEQMQHRSPTRRGQCS